MNTKERKEDRKKKYDETLLKYPYHADGYKRFIYRDGKQKDNYAFLQITERCEYDLKRLASCSKELFDEEFDDLQAMLLSTFGKKTMKKLAKVFAIQ